VSDIESSVWHQLQFQHNQLESKSMTDLSSSYQKVIKQSVGLGDTLSQIGTYWYAVYTQNELWTVCLWWHDW